MVDILLYQFRFAEALQKKSYGPNEQVLHQYKLSHSLHVLAVLQQATKKNRLGPRNPSPQPSPTANPVPVFPGGCLAPAGSLGLPSSSVSTAVPAPWAWLLVSLLFSRTCT